MNLKNLVGKSIGEQKDLYEIELIADFDMEYGQSGNWSPEIEDEFNKKWEAIQNRFKV